MAIVTIFVNAKHAPPYASQLIQKVGGSVDKQVKEYYEEISESRKPGINYLHEIILDEFPDATVDMKYGMPTYSYHEGWVAIANQKNYISLYTCGYHHIKDFKEKFPKIKSEHQTQMKFP